jgi:DNA-directed RNA polymerase specialized sigma24 family protein
MEPQVLDVELALQKLEQLDARAARAVELRFFSGLTEAEASEVLGVSIATLKRDWEFARVWLLRELSRPS